ncbi:MAG: hypothetical protein ABH808_00735 [Candidatus Kuenenbacteria bacterium]
MKQDKIEIIKKIKEINEWDDEMRKKLYLELKNLLENNNELNITTEAIETLGIIGKADDETLNSEINYALYLKLNDPEEDGMIKLVIFDILGNFGIPDLKTMKLLHKRTKDAKINDELGYLPDFAGDHASDALKRIEDMIKKQND